jgi:hypothetical protein
MSTGHTGSTRRFKGMGQEQLLLRRRCLNGLWEVPRSPPVVLDLAYPSDPALVGVLELFLLT